MPLQPISTASTNFWTRVRGSKDIALIPSLADSHGVITRRKADKDDTRRDSYPFRTRGWGELICSWGFFRSIGDIPIGHGNAIWAVCRACGIPGLGNYRDAVGVSRAVPSHGRDFKAMGTVIRCIENYANRVWPGIPNRVSYR